jgi:hypothetical protein
VLDSRRNCVLSLHQPQTEQLCVSPNLGMTAAGDDLNNSPPSRAYVKVSLRTQVVTVGCDAKTLAFFTITRKLYNDV